MNNTENKHLPYGGSTAGRTMACPAWIRLSQDVPKQPSSVYADEGNLLHDCMEEHYMNNADFAIMLKKGMTYGSVKLTEEHEELYDIACNATDKVLNDYAIDEFACEAFVQLIPDEVGGSIDMIGKSTHNKVAMVLDYKFGHNAVPVENNASLQFYMMCARHDPNYKDLVDGMQKLVYVIIQPKVSAEPIIWESNIGELNDFARRWDEAYKASKTEQEPKSGNHCRYCPVAPYCSKQKEVAMSALAINPKQAVTLSESLDLVAKLSTWIKEVEETAITLLRQGAKIPNYKLVEKRATTRWIDVDVAERELAQKLYEKIYKTELLSPTQVGKIAKAEGISIDHLIEKRSSGTTIAPESDKRPGIDPLAIPDNLLKIVTANTAK